MLLEGEGRRREAVAVYEAVAPAEDRDRTTEDAKAVRFTALTRERLRELRPGTPGSAR